ncbi:MAG: hypothetical protein FWF54_01585 [Candidatus Azobacteroides sp.]|nr:hypothetical protein [Candidatus Azobacteroides sp.]
MVEIMQAGNKSDINEMSDDLSKLTRILRNIRNGASLCDSDILDWMDKIDYIQDKILSLKAPDAQEGGES